MKNNIDDLSTILCCSLKMLSGSNNDKYLELIWMNFVFLLF